MTGTADEVLHYARILQLIGAVSTSTSRSNRSAEADPADHPSWTAGSSDSFAVKLPGKLHILLDKKTIVQESTRLLDLECVPLPLLLSLSRAPRRS